MIKLEKVARPGSLKASEFPFSEMKEVDLDSFLIPVTTEKEASAARARVKSDLDRFKKDGQFEDLKIKSSVVREDKQIVGIRFWKA